MLAILTGVFEMTRNMVVILPFILECFIPQKIRLLFWQVYFISQEISYVVRCVLYLNVCLLFCQVYLYHKICPCYIVMLSYCHLYSFVVNFPAFWMCVCCVGIIKHVSVDSVMILYSQH